MFGTRVYDVDAIELIPNDRVGVYLDHLYDLGSRFILIIGPVGSGKTDFIKNGIRQSSVPISHLNNGAMLEAISPYHNMTSGKIHEALNRIEEETIKLSAKNNNLLIIKESHGMITHSRYIRDIPNDRIDLLVMATPEQILLERLRQKTPNRFTAAQRQLKIENDILNFQWPQKGEGWRTVRYINQHYYSEIETLRKHLTDIAYMETR